LSYDAVHSKSGPSVHRHPCTLLLTRLAAAAAYRASIKTEILGMPVGAGIELRLKVKQRLRGARGAVSDFGFMLVDRSGERQIAFHDVSSVKQVKAKSHTARTY
jgi:predicted NBD/HSP70 family sugar kinase